VKEEDEEHAVTDGSHDWNAVQSMSHAR